VAKKVLTRKQAETAKRRAELFVTNVLGDEDRGNEIADQSVDEWAEDTGRKITNPWRKKVANGITTSDLQETIDQACDVLNEAYTPEASREDLASAVGQALEILSGDDDQGDDDDDQDDDDVD
jgi:hypothetical protein